jgi:hypothetical protein
MLRIRVFNLLGRKLQILNERRERPCDVGLGL